MSSGPEVYVPSAFLSVEGGCDKGFVLIILLVIDQTSSFFCREQNSLKFSVEALQMESEYSFLS